MSVDGLRPLLQVLAERSDLRRDGLIDDALAAVLPDDSPADQLEMALAGLGMRLRWLHVGAAEAVAQARPDLPVVGFDVTQGGRFWLLDRASGSRARAVQVGGDGSSRWVRPAELLGVEAWARVEPLLPAAAWSSGGGPAASPTQRVWGLVRGEGADITVVCVYAAAVGVLSLATPLAIQVLINQLAFGVVLQPILFLGGALFFVLALAACLRIAKRHTVEIIQRRIFVRAVADLAARFTRLRVDALDGRFIPELANRFFDVLTLQKAVATMLLDGASAVLQAVVGFAILALYHPALLVFDLLAIVTVALVMWPLGRGAEKSAIYESKAKYAVASWLEELARHPLVFKLGTGALGEHRADRLTRKYLDYRLKHFAIFFRQYVGMQVAHVLLQVVLLVTCGWLVLEGQLTLGQLVAAEFIVGSALTGAVKFTDKLETVYDLLAGIDKIGALLDLETELPGGVRRRVRQGGAALTMDSVVVGVGPALTVTLKPGDRLGLWGPPKAALSAWAEVFAGVRRPRQGDVSRDGSPIERLSADQRFDEVMLLRAGGVIQGTVDDNLTLGRRLSPPEAWAALDAVGLSDAVRALSDGLSASLGAEGEPLSESQIVDLLVARATVSGARLLVVDGLLDGLPPAHRDRLLQLLTQLPCTLIVLTEDDAVARATGRSLEWTAEGWR
jgi:putative ABC transport system ATP-binding protein